LYQGNRDDLRVVMLANNETVMKEMCVPRETRTGRELTINRLVHM
jgi:hypothetical protein